MNADWLLTIFRWESIAIISLLFLGVAYKAVTGHINLKGLLADKETHAFSPGRLQLLIVTLVGVGVYLRQLAQSPPGTLPAPNIQMLSAIAASQGVYLTGKAVSRIRSWFRTR